MNNKVNQIFLLREFKINPELLKTGKRFGFFDMSFDISFQFSVIEGRLEDAIIDAKILGLKLQKMICGD